MSVDWAPLPEAVVDGKLYAVGGQDDGSILSSVEIFDPSTGQWSAVAATMSTGRKSLAVAAMECPE